ncbi:MAG: NERD domain-containing protein [Proteobacteria bacterium]|nr:NERD domain-containing protein [Pseudomonadota bacterium]
MFIVLFKVGYKVYHDFPAEKFNIDHIIIGPAGVYAVETKARQKPTTGNNPMPKLFMTGKSFNFRIGWILNLLNRLAGKPNGFLNG